MRLADYYAALDVRVTWTETPVSSRRALADLFERSAEFNLNGASWAEMWPEDGGDRVAWSIAVADRFGDYGLTGACVASWHDDVLDVIALALNCRVLGKQVEARVLGRLAAEAGRRGLARLSLRYRPTRRNHLIQEFLAQARPGFDARRAAPLSWDVGDVPDLTSAPAGERENGSGPAVVDAALALPFDPRRDEATVLWCGAEAATGAEIARAVRTGRASGAREVLVPPAPPERMPGDHRVAGAAERVAAIWSEVLGLPGVGWDEPFFGAGGHSLSLMRVCGRLREEFDRNIPLVELFRHPTVRAQAAYLCGLTSVPAGTATAGAEDTGGAGGVPHGDELIAVVGVSCRIPGADDAAKFWDLLTSGREAVRTVPVAPGAVDLVPRLGFVEGIDRFDHEFFHTTPREAEITDPQQRLLLECAWHALEDAACIPERVGDRIGVFAGSGTNDHLSRLNADRELRETVGHAQLLLGNAKDYLAGRIAFRLGLRGPAVTVQTACSSSLVAVHQAVRALLSGECDTALAGGVSLTTLDEEGYRYEPGGIFAPDGHCRAFSDDAAGTVPGNGAALVVLRRLADAVRDGDPIRAVIRGSAVNNDGADKVGFTAPSVSGQERAIADALADAGLTPDDIGYVEAHGTGTPMGDPIELTALQQAFTARTSPDPVLVGSVKSVLGHLDTASGVVGLIKAVLMVQHGQVPATLNVSRPMAAFDFAAGVLELATTPRVWTGGPERPRRAGVSSFGIGGTNAHVIIEEAPSAPAPPAGPDAPDLVLVSAPDAEGLERAKDRLRGWARDHPGAPLPSVAATTRLGRRHFTHRAALTCDSTAGLGSAPDRDWGQGIAAEDRPIIMMFPGQGVALGGIAGPLRRAEPLFGEQLDACLDILISQASVDVSPWLLGAASEPCPAEVIQPALFALEYALAALWRSWGITPAAAIGHSVGEYVAATLSGVFTLTEALTLVAERGRLMARLPPGAMLAVTCGPRELAARLPADLWRRLDLAAENAPARCVVAGREADISLAADALAVQGLVTRRLPTSHAFHSRMTEPVLPAFAAAVASRQLGAPGLPVVSTVTGDWFEPGRQDGPAYWAEQLRRPVRFAAGVAVLLRDLPDAVWLECGPRAGLTGAVRQQSSHPLLQSGPDRADPVRHLRIAVGRLWSAGAPVDLARLSGGRRPPLLSLPGHPFRRTHFPIRHLPGDGGPAATSPVATPTDGRRDARHGVERPGAPSAPELTGLHQVVALIWEELLGVEPTRPDDDFFVLHGDSLTGTRYAARVRDVLGVEIPLRSLFERPTVAGQAAVIRTALRAVLPEEELLKVLGELGAHEISEGDGHG
ncbi:acyltransferase domain-containing protein [Nonomuraea sp. KC401]|uniref:type I polyketide synthase n=1 Tax=unclassified Nonomuraea TaxID=2593643 RepID=UPI0010FE2B99|nr:MULTISPECIES: type I polyketide synthase [unclassified Nonomuraea]NBE98001.1 acyltransferase domain-containing protein [Nonomuraea sp. K271]TLF61823.1 acyltransferase domain-containing protein [Nonomuraea sp. KC401]